MIGGVTGYIAWRAAGSPEGKAWAYIGVGAAAGALSAGVGSGVNAAIAGNAAAGGGFGAGFAGTATISSTGFIAGAASGAAAGVTNGLISGTGYGMLGGQNFENAFVAGGLDQAWKQGLSGAAVGGVFGGIDAAVKNRNFWTGGYKTHSFSEPEFLASLNGGTGISGEDDVLYTVKNNSGEIIYYKPETDNPVKGIRGDGAYPLKNGRALVDPVDGVTAPGRPLEVFKITDPFSQKITGVTVYNKTVLVEPRVFSPLTNDVNSIFDGGWLSSPPDAGWHEIFRKSGYIIR